MKVNELLEEKAKKEVRPETKVLRVVREIARSIKIAGTTKSFFDIMDFGMGASQKQYPKWGLWAFEFQFTVPKELEAEVDPSDVFDDDDDEVFAAASKRVKARDEGGQHWMGAMKTVIRALENSEDFELVGVSTNDKVYSGGIWVNPKTYKYKQEDIIDVDTFMASKEKTPLFQAGSMRLWFKLDTSAPHMHAKHGDLSRITPSKLSGIVNDIAYPLMKELDSNLHMIAAHAVGGKDSGTQIVYGKVDEVAKKRYPHRASPDLDNKPEVAPDGLLAKVKKAIEASPEFKELNVPNARFSIDLKVEDISIVPYWAMRWNRDGQTVDQPAPMEYQALTINLTAPK